MKAYTLEESRGHVVSVTEYGNPSGPAILNFHGGPGSGSRPHHAERFDLKKYRVILFDQRGCGKSTPLGELENNTTEDILLDAERIREKLGIDTWFVAGSSWGATLALLYAIKYPKRVRGILIAAVFLADIDSMSWSMSDPKGVARLMPDVWARRMEFFRKFDIGLETQNKDLLRLLQDSIPDVQKEITAGIQNWERNLFSVQSPISYAAPEDITDTDIASAKIFVYYEMNHEFIPDNHILDSIKTIAHVPTIIVHGRYDILCTVDKAQMLKDRMNKCELVITPTSGHIPSAEGRMILMMAFDRFLEKQLRT